MQITEIRLVQKRDGRLLALVNVVFDGCFLIRGLKLIEGQDGRRFVAMPNRRRQDGAYLDVAHPLTADFRKYLEDTVIGEYTRQLSAEPERSDHGSARRESGDFE